MTTTNPNVYVLKKPIEFDGEQVVSLDLDFDNLTGDDILSAERQYNTESAKIKDFAFVKEMSKSYLVFIVARAAKKPAELICKLSGNDFSRVTVLAQNFLLS